MIVQQKKKNKGISRYTTLTIIMISIFVVIMGKLVYLQVYKKSEYQERADNISSKFLSEKTPRGMIIDSDGEVLATNKQAYVVTYTETKETNDSFFTTMKELFKILEEHNETIVDEMLLKVNEENELYFDFKTTQKENQKAEEIRFKRDRGLNEKIAKDLFGNLERDLKEEEIKQVNEELLK
ncbi:MAG: penicillin-binding protein, partial [Clostridium sp.]